MLWLIALVSILQFVFHWLLKPAIVLSTPLFEVRGLGFLIVLLAIWLFAGREKIQGYR